VPDNPLDLNGNDTPMMIPISPQPPLLPPCDAAAATLVPVQNKRQLLFGDALPFSCIQHSMPFFQTTSSSAVHDYVFKGDPSKAIPHLRCNFSRC